MSDESHLIQLDIQSKRIAELEAKNERLNHLLQQGAIKSTEVVAAMSEEKKRLTAELDKFEQVGWLVGEIFLPTAWKDAASVANLSKDSVRVYARRTK